MSNVQTEYGNKLPKDFKPDEVISINGEWIVINSIIKVGNKFIINDNYEIIDNKCYFFKKWLKVLDGKEI